MRFCARRVVGVPSRAAIEAGDGPERHTRETQALTTSMPKGEAVDTFGERVAVCLDMRGDRLVARGGEATWEAPGTLNDVREQFRLVVTDVTRDGQMRTETCWARVADQTPARIIASKSQLPGRRALRALGIEGDHRKGPGTRAHSLADAPDAVLDTRNSHDSTPPSLTRRTDWRSACR